MILDCFAGCGGWDEGARSLGLETFGIEVDPVVCRTRYEAGHATWVQDVSKVEPKYFQEIDGLIASPPCQSWSVAGLRKGWQDARGQLVLEVPRWVEAIHPRWIACEQVPPVLPIWKQYARWFEEMGYHTWVGVLQAANYGVPQTRERAFLLAHKDRAVQPPDPTHSEHEEEAGLFTAAREKWVSMADALGWDDVTVNTRGDRKTSGGNEFSANDPSWALTEKTRSWILRAGNVEGHPPVYRTPDEPAPAVAFGHNAYSWAWEKPATTVAGDPRITARCHHDEGSQGKNPKTTTQVRAGDYEGTEPIKLTVQEALVLQGFREDYPVQGSRTRQFGQVGDACPVQLAAAIIRELSR